MGANVEQDSVQVLTAGSLEPGVAVLVQGRPRTLFVLGRRCDDHVEAAYWDCLLRPLVFEGRRYTGTGYPAEPSPQGRVPLTGSLGRATLNGTEVTVRRIEGVDPSTGRRRLGAAERGLSRRLGLSVRRVLEQAGLRRPAPLPPEPGLVHLRSTRWSGRRDSRRPKRPHARLAGRRSRTSASFACRSSRISFRSRARPLRPSVGSATRSRSTVPDVPAGLYEAVVSCPSCGEAAGGQSLFPAGSILIEEKAKTSRGIRIVSYVLLGAFVLAAVLAIVVWRRRRRHGPTLAHPDRKALDPVEEVRPKASRGPGELDSAEVGEHLLQPDPQLESREVGSEAVVGAS